MLEITDRPIFPFQCHKILPLTFDDSLSYYEVLCKMRDTINAIIAAGETGLTPWGEIQGDIQDQSDLQAEFATKQGKLTVNPTGASATLNSLEIDGVKYNIGGTSTGATWGSITGTLSNQTDLQAALTALNTLIAEKSTVTANPFAPATVHLLKVTIDGTTYDFQSELPVASASTLGGIKAAAKTSSDTVEAKIGSDGKLYVPAAATGQSVAGVTVNGTNVVDATDNVAKIPAASSAIYGAILVGDGLRIDGVSGKTEVAVADTEDIDEERSNAIIDAANVRYAAVEAMKDTAMSSADKTAIKNNLEIGSGSGVSDVQLNGVSVVTNNVASIPYATVATTGVLQGNGAAAEQTERAGVQNGQVFTKPIPSVSVSTSTAAGADTVQSITIDGTPHNLPSGGGGGSTVVYAGNGIEVTAASNGYNVAAKPKTSGGISVTSAGIGHSNLVGEVSSNTLLKVAYDINGHITGSEAVTKNDITGLGIPGSSTTIGAADDSINVTGTGNAYSIGAKIDQTRGLNVTSNGIGHSNTVAEVTSNSLVKVKYDQNGHITGSSAVTKSDVTGLGIPGQDTVTTIGAADNSVNVSGSNHAYSISANLKSNGGLALDNANGLYVESCNGLKFQVVQSLPQETVANTIYFVFQQ